MALLKLLVFLSFGALLSDAHIRLQEPPQRASLWRDERFAAFNPPMPEDDTGIYCGPVLQPPEVDNCGVCGDRFTDPVPRSFEHGGVYGRGIIAGNYTRSQVIPFTSFLRINHAGFIFAELCDEIPESEACFQKFPKLRLSVDGINSDTIDVPTGSDVWINGTMALPAPASCRHCVLRLSYRGNNPAGAEMQQHYRNCADISISL